MKYDLKGCDDDKTIEASRGPIAGKHQRALHSGSDVRSSTASPSIRSGSASIAAASSPRGLLHTRMRFFETEARTCGVSACWELDRAYIFHSQPFPCSLSSLEP